MYDNTDLKLKPPVLSFVVMLCSVILLLLFLVITALFTSRGYEELMLATANEQNTGRQVVIIDAGHGGEDPGAVANGVIEKNVNLAIALNLRDMLALTDVDVVLTRDSDRMLYGDEIVISKKNDDLINRAKYAAEADGRIFISLHCNKFAMQSQNGLQTFYSQNNDNSALLAENIQSASKSLLMPDNKRLIKPGNDTILILQRAKCAAVLVECGFLSNEAEAERLSDSDYQARLAFAVLLGLSNYLEAG